MESVNMILTVSWSTVNEKLLAGATVCLYKSTQRVSSCPLSIIMQSCSVWPALIFLMYIWDEPKLKRWRPDVILGLCYPSKQRLHRSVPIAYGGLKQACQQCTSNCMSFSLSGATCINLLLQLYMLGLWYEMMPSVGYSQVVIREFSCTISV